MTHSEKRPLTICSSATMVCVETVAMLLLLYAVQVCTGLRKQSFDEAVLECAELLLIHPRKMESISGGILGNDDDTKSLIRCVGVSCRFWSDYTGLRRDIIERYFTPDASDTLYRNRTQACLKKLPVLSFPFNHRNQRDLAYRSFLCYYHNYGNLKRTRNFVPMDSVRLLELARQCMNVLCIGVEDLVDLTVAELDENRSVHCMVRCIGLQTGLYSDRYGVNIDLVYAQYGEGYDEATFKANAYSCVRNQSATSSDDPCRRAYNLLYKCFENVRNIVSRFEVQESYET
ncbi:general odorant-binding protein 45-like [Anopheles cruzii]|uniref:general odorant-binding protein 45-like n=1 Tax=Anopheles cruzii TaxID=68878 RepID=UPI0022EC98FF|nr:general odorant-binding protein 45-like [Anopheles cruzii]